MPAPSSASCSRPRSHRRGDGESVLVAALVRGGRPGRLRDALRAWQAVTVDAAVLQILAEVARGRDVLRAGDQPERLSSPIHIGRSGLRGILRSCVLLVRNRVHQARSSVLSRSAGRAAPPARPSVIHRRSARKRRLGRRRGHAGDPSPTQWPTDSGKALRRLLDTAGYGAIMSSGTRE